MALSGIHRGWGIRGEVRIHSWGNSVTLSTFRGIREKTLNIQETEMKGGYFRGREPSHIISVGRSRWT